MPEPNSMMLDLGVVRVPVGLVKRVTPTIVKADEGTVPAELCEADQGPEVSSQ
jgi:hypothetical protein